jgi:thiosulfate/3-mercaptopyruvate sulfurtransferase
MRSGRHRVKLRAVSFTTLINVAALAELPSDAVLLDCRFDLADSGAGRRAYLAGHIPGARYADLNQDLAAPLTAASGRHPLPEPADLRRFFMAAGVVDGTQVIAYDEANGAFAARAWWLLRWLGFGTAAVLDGGLKAWNAAGGALETGEPARRAIADAGTARLTVRLQPDLVSSATDVLRGLGDPGRLLVDARAPERFTGRVEPLDPVAGHVPGAVNHPFTGNLAGDGRFLGTAELRRRWTDLLAGRSPSAMTAMCGSGVTACHNLLAMAAAGLPGARLYAGSWSEWIRDPDRPVARD